MSEGSTDDVPRDSWLIILGIWLLGIGSIVASVGTVWSFAGAFLAAIATVAALLVTPPEVLQS